MNKTVNINLAGTFFHIDENAFERLNRYLDSVRKSLSNDAGADEIMKDIEARIAELFSEKINNSNQVVTLREVEEVIAVMGQPEDYSVDEEIFDDQPKQEKQQKSPKQLFRDPDDKYISGVSSGLGHYLGIDAVWVRLLWILLSVFSSGTFILIYIVLWIIVPEASSVADKLKMKGQPVNVSNIEKKVKEEFNNVADRVKNADLGKIKTGSETFFSAIGKVITVLFQIFVKFIGVILLMIAGGTLITLIISLFFGGISHSVGVSGDDFFAVDNDFFLPYWGLLILIFFAVGIPFFYLFVAGLKILIKNLKSLGKTVNISLVSIWILSVVGLIFFGVYQATERSYDGNVIETNEIPIKAADTLYLSMFSNTFYEKEMSKRHGFSVRYDENENKVIFSKNIRLVVKSTKDSLAKVVVEKQAKGRDYLKAKNRSEQIQYNYRLDGQKLELDGYFISDFASGYRNQRVEVTLYLPVGTTLYADNNTRSYHMNTTGYGDLLDRGMEEKYLIMQSGKLLCEDCPEDSLNNVEKVHLNIKIESDTDKTEINWSDEDWKENLKQKNVIIKKSTIHSDTLYID
ncbi:MAG TPA: PspC domain-containing protein [Flavobacteriaceae bacterium]|nr:PspC domain-containing protein [Flavobacteriaceae bacterium]